MTISLSFGLGDISCQDRLREDHNDWFEGPTGPESASQTLPEPSRTFCAATSTKAVYFFTRFFIGAFLTRTLGVLAQQEDHVGLP